MAETAIPGMSGSPMTLEQIERRIQDRFPNVSTTVQYGELTIHVAPELLLDVLTFCRDDDELRCGMLTDLSGVHWPAGDQVIDRQPSTTGWPEYRISREHGVIEILYIVRSIERNHWFRLSVGTPDDDPSLPSATGVYASADYPEREVYDFFGVQFDGHPNLTRILMPDDWVGHPHRKDYPLGGVDVPYENDKFIPPPNERDLRDIVGGDGQ